LLDRVFNNQKMGENGKMGKFLERKWENGTNNYLYKNSSREKMKKKIIVARKIIHSQGLFRPFVIKSNYLHKNPKLNLCTHNSIKVLKIKKKMYDTTKFSPSFFKK